MRITENGCSTAEDLDDPERVAFPDGHIAAVSAAGKVGIDVRGYFVRSLPDNFEWAEGYHQRLGLIHVDFPTGTRTPRASHYRLRERIGAGRPG
ncbi:family 1 glycosylhydrolase [Embleya sp. NPDC001921]